MDAKVLFIDPERIKSMSVIGDNCDEKLLKNSLWELQDLDLRDIMTGEYFESISNEIAKQSVSDKTAKFLEKAAPYLIYGTIVNYLTATHYKVTNKGVFTKTDTAAVAVSPESFGGLVATYKSKADTHLRRLIKFLKVDGIDNDVNRHDTTEGTGLYLGDDDAIDWQTIRFKNANKIR